MDRDLDVGIVGGGPSGLAFALSLVDAGFSSVTVLEKESRVGGKCRTVDLEEILRDGKVTPGVKYELGASSMSHRYTRVKALLDRFEIARKEVTTSRYFDWDVPGADATESPWTKAIRTDFLPLLLRALVLLPRAFLQQQLERPGFLYTDEQHVTGKLSQPLEARLRALGVAQLEPAFRALVTGIGYGYIERDAAAYLWKYLSVWVPMLPFTLQPTEYELFETGYQGFFERIAEHLDRTAEPRRRRVVRTGCKVTRVERPEGERPITVHLDGQQEPLSFDRLVLACPLDAAARFLDADNDERELLQKIRSYTFHTLFATVRDYPANRWAFYLSNCRPGHAPRPVLSARRHFELDHVVFYVLEEHDPQVITGDGPCYFDVDPRNLPGTERRRDDHIREIWDSLEVELRTRMGLTGVTRHRHVAWKYFPHYSTEDVARGAPIELERRQGLRRTYYIGEVMDFSVIERCVLYAEHTAKQHFTG